MTVPAMPNPFTDAFWSFDHRVGHLARETMEVLSCFLFRLLLAPTMAVRIHTPNTHNLIFTCEDALSYLQISHITHVQGVGLNHAIFASEEVMVSPLGVKDGHKGPCKDSNVTALMLTTSCRVSGAHPSLTLFATILLPLVSPPWHMGWDTALFVGKYPMFTQAP